MANLSAHLSAATAGAGLVATMYMGGEVATLKEALAFWGAGILGGILPDIDSDRSVASRTIFNLLGLVTGLLVLFNRSATYSIVEMWLVCSATYAFVRYPVLYVFFKLTAHRGIFHSIVAGLFFQFLSVAVCSRLFHLSAPFSWTFGTFLFLGFVIHLLLDEISSVDLINATVKRSFGSALKIVDFSRPRKSVLMAGAAAAVLFLTPPVHTYKTLFLNGHDAGEIKERLFPGGSWFVDTVSWKVRHWQYSCSYLGPPAGDPSLAGLAHRPGSIAIPS